MRIHIVGGNLQRKYFELKNGDEVWGINAQFTSERWKWMPRWDRCFNIHRYDLLKAYGYSAFDKEVAWALRHPRVPFYTIDKWLKPHALPNWNKLPAAAMAKAMPMGHYHCGTFDWLVAFAAFHDRKSVIEEIHLHGIGLCLEAGEPISARACLEYWCGYAAGRGIKIVAAPDCDPFHFYHLVKSNLIYGYDNTPIYEVRNKKIKGAHYKLNGR